MEIKRDLYLQKLISFMWDGQIKVLTLPMDKSRGSVKVPKRINPGSAYRCPGKLIL
jgi:hypothetical protein